MNEKTRIGNIKKIEKHEFDNIELLETDHKTIFINNTFLHIFLIIIIGFLSYANTFHVPFQWDEGYFIVDNPIVKDIGFFKEPSSAHSLGNAYKFKGSIGNAIEQYQIALRLKPDYAGCHFNLNLVFLKKGNAGDALKEFKILLRLNPDDYEAKHYIDLISKKKSERSQLILTGGSE